MGPILTIHPPEATMEENSHPSSSESSSQGLAVTLTIIGCAAVTSTEGPVLLRGHRPGATSLAFHVFRHPLTIVVSNTSSFSLLGFPGPAKETEAS